MSNFWTKAVNGTKEMFSSNFFKRPAGLLGLILSGRDLYWGLLNQNPFFRNSIFGALLMNLMLASLVGAGSYGAYRLWRYIREDVLHFDESEKFDASYVDSDDDDSDNDYDPDHADLLADQRRTHVDGVVPVSLTRQPLTWLLHKAFNGPMETDGQVTVPAYQAPRGTHVGGYHLRRR